MRRTALVLRLSAALVLTVPLAIRAESVSTTVGLDPARLAAQLREHGRAEIDLPGAALLGGAWQLPPGTLTVRAHGSIVADGWRLDAPGLVLTLQGADVRLGGGSRLDVAQPLGVGGAVSLIATGDDDATVEVAAGSRVDASGAPGRGGRILLSADRVVANGSLFARGAGRIEVEARSDLRFTGPADTAGGLIRLDPSNMIIGSFGSIDTNVTNGTSGTALTRSPSADTGMLDAGNLAMLLDTNDVIVHTVSSGTATGVILPAGFTAMDAIGGDIDVQADVVWASSHFLWLLAHDDLIVRANVQNAGGAAGGSLVGIAGWDGTTFTDLDTDPLDPASSTVYGAVTDASPPMGFTGRGDVFILGPAGLGAPGIAFGSRIGPTVLAGGDVSVLGSTDTVAANNAFALVGFRVTTVGGGASGDIRVLSKGFVRVASGGSGDERRQPSLRPDRAGGRDEQEQRIARRQLPDPPRQSVGQRDGQGARRDLGARWPALSPMLKSATAAAPTAAPRAATSAAISTSKGTRCWCRSGRSRSAGWTRRPPSP